MAAPDSTVWGSAVGNSEGHEAKLGIYTSVVTTLTTATVTIDIYFYSEYSVTDNKNTFYFNNESTSATTSQGVVNISHTSNNAWNMANQTKIGSYTYTYDRKQDKITKNCAAKLSEIEAVANKDLIVTTSYEIPALPSYTVNVDPNGGYRVSTGSTDVVTYTQYYGVSEEITERRRTGYTLVGYLISNSSTGSTSDIGGATIVFNNDTKTANFVQGSVAVTLTAQWTANQYTVVYHGNGNTEGSTEESIHTYDVPKFLTKNDFTKTGYTFKNWRSESDVVYADEESVINLTSENGAIINLYAQWAANYYTLTLDGNGGNPALQTTRLLFDSSGNRNLTTYEPIRTGYGFLGWFTENDIQVYDNYNIAISEGMYWKDGKYVYPDDLTLYAHWEPLNVAYVKENGTYVLCNTYIKEDDTWKKAILYQKINDRYNRSIID